MNRRLALALLIPCLLGPTTGRAQVGTAPIAMPSRSALSRLGLEKLWYTVVPLDGTSEKILLINLVEDLLFVQTNHGHLHAYNAETGRYLWGINEGVATLDARAVAINSDSVFVTNSRNLLCLDRRTGRTNWTVNLGLTVADSTREGGTAVGIPAATEDRVLVGVAGGKLVAFNARATAGNAKFNGRSAGTLAWNWQTEANLVGRAIPTAQVVAFASLDKKVYVCQDNPPALLYRFLTSGPISASMGHYGTRTLLVPSEDGNLYAIDLFTGESRWTAPTGSPLKREPLVSDESIYILNSTGRLFSIHAADGKTEWVLPSNADRTLSVGQSRIYLDSQDRDLIIVDRKTGKELAGTRETRERAGVDLRAYSKSMTNRQNDRMYLATPAGMILVLREIGATAPRPLHHPEAKPFGWLDPNGEAAAVTPPAAPPAEEEKPEEPPK